MIVRNGTSRFGIRALVLGFLLACTAFAPAVAADGWFAGAGVGQTKFDIDTSGLKFDSDDTGFEIYAGKRFFKYGGVELGYADLGDFHDSRNGVTWKASADVLSVFLLGVLPASPKLDLYGKLGLVRWEADSSTTFPAPADAISNDADGTDAGYGMGLLYRVTDRWGLRLEFEEYDFDEVDSVRFGSLGVQYSF